jgi:hypothetical protein
MLLSPRDDVGGTIPSEKRQTPRPPVVAHRRTTPGWGGRTRSPIPPDHPRPPESVTIRSRPQW